MSHQFSKKQLAGLIKDIAVHTGAKKLATYCDEGIMQRLSATQVSNAADDVMQVEVGQVEFLADNGESLGSVSFTTEYSASRKIEVAEIHDYSQSIEQFMDAVLDA